MAWGHNLVSVNQAGNVVISVDQGNVPWNFKRDAVTSHSFAACQSAHTRHAGTNHDARQLQPRLALDIRRLSHPLGVRRVACNLDHGCVRTLHSHTHLLTLHVHAQQAPTGREAVRWPHTLEAPSVADIPGQARLILLKACILRSSSSVATDATSRNQPAIREPICPAHRSRVRSPSLVFLPRADGVVRCTHDPNAWQSGESGPADCSLPSGCLVKQTDESQPSFGDSFAQAGGGVWAVQYDIQGVL